MKPPFRRVLDYDFNSPPERNGAYLVAPDFTALVPGQEVILRDRDGGLERLCRVRYLIAAVEPIGEFKDIP